VVYDPVIQGGVVVGGVNPRYQESRQDIDDYNFAEATAALVFDNSLFGFTSPFAGQRYRFEVSPTVGTLNFVSALADYRRYLWFQPFTLAGRGLHFGRYGLNQGEGQRIGEIFLGQPMLMRGYDYGTLVDRCIGRTQGTAELIQECTILNSLFGNQIAVFNAELRFPLIRALVLGTGIGVPPIEGFAFYDAGMAWGDGATPVFRTGLQADPMQRGILSSVGVGARVNLFGFAIVEVDYVRPLVGDLGWRWQFALQPGF
jgi:outer membrane protein assembly factor BamA